MVTVIPVGVSSELFSHLNAQLSCQHLAEEMAHRLALNDEQLLEAVGQGYTARQISFAELHGDQNLVRTIREENGKQCSATFLGRNFEVIDHLRKGQYLPQKPLRILEGGVGLTLWKYLDHFIPGLLATARQWGYQGDGMPYEILELALLAREGGRVDAVELDQRILSSLEEVLKKGLIMHQMECLTLHASKIDSQKLAVDRDTETIVAYDRWMDYVNHFSRQVAARYEALAVLHGGKAVDIGARIFLNQDVFATMRFSTADLATFPLPDTYDLAWLVNIYHYMPTGLWWALLIRTVATLSVATAEKKYGGILVTNRFDLDPFVQSLPFVNRIGEFLILAGLELLEEVESPLEHNRKMIIAHRVQETPWLAEQVKKLRELGLCGNGIFTDVT